MQVVWLRCVDCLAGRPHWQLGISFASPRTVGKGLYKSVDEALGSLGMQHCHVEAAKSWDDVKKYVTKEDGRLSGPWEWKADGYTDEKGVKVKKGRVDKSDQGTRTDLKVFNDDVKKGTKLEELQEKHMGIEAKYMKYFDRVISRNTPNRRSPPNVIVLYGPPGTGKSRAVNAINDAAGRKLYTVSYPKSSGVPWFNGYNGKDDLLLDEYSEEACFSMEFLLQLLDRNAFKVRTDSDGTAMVTCENIYITSMQTPATWYARKVNFLGAFTRRVTEMYELSYKKGFELVADESAEFNKRVADNAEWTCVKKKADYVKLVQEVWPNVTVIDGTRSSASTDEKKMEEEEKKRELKDKEEAEVKARAEREREAEAKAAAAVMARMDVKHVKPAASTPLPPTQPVAQLTPVLKRSHAMTGMKAVDDTDPSKKRRKLVAAVKKVKVKREPVGPKTEFEGQASKEAEVVMDSDEEGWFNEAVGVMESERARILTEIYASGDGTQESVNGPDL